MVTSKPMERPMSSKIILALATVATLAAGTLAPTSASAWGHGGFRGGHFGHFSHFGHYGRFSHAWRSSHYGRFGHYWRFHRWHSPRYTYWHRWNYRWSPGYRTYGYSAYTQAPQAAVASVPAAPVQTAAPVQAAAPANCLTKAYLADGTVLFRDICTNEVAEGPQ